MSVRILLVEDDPVSQDLLRSVLHARGYAVDAVSDGFPGLRLLKERAYDLALIDYHLPELDGYAMARLMRDAGRAPPKLVAMTADRHGLMARSGADALFDAVLTKPIEPQRLFRFIETLLDVPGERASARAAEAFLRDPGHERARAAAEAFWRDRGLAGRPKARPAPEPTPEQASALGFCFDEGGPEDADLIVLLDRRGIERLPALHARLPGRPTPVVDVTGRALEGCDAAFRVDDPSSWSEVAALIQRYQARSASLPASARSADADARLLACLVVAERSLRIPDPPSQAPIRPGGWLTESDAMLAAERLTRRGLLSLRRLEGPGASREFVFAPTKDASALLSAEPGGDGPARSSPEAARDVIERTVREASKAFAEPRAGAVQAGSAPALAGVKPLMALDRLSAQGERGAAARAAEQGTPAKPAAKTKTVAEPEPPARRAPAAEGHDVQAFLDLIKPPVERRVPARPAAAGARILLVEDVDVSRETACAMLEAGGYAVDPVASGAEAIAAVQNRSYGLVLMDVQMPGMDGLEAARRIRAHPPCRHVPILAMSASATPGQIAAFNAAGMSGHIAKPIRREDLTAAVERWRLPERDDRNVLDRAVYDGLLDLVGREKVLALLDRLAAQLLERFTGDPESDDDRARLTDDAHAMTSAAGALGFSGLSSACQSLEAACARSENVAAHLDRVRASRAAVLRTISALKQAA